MKKKIIPFALSLLAVTALASCTSSSDDLKKIREDEVTDEAKAYYNISFFDTIGSETTTARLLDTTQVVDDTTASENYYAVYLAQDYVNSLFVFETPLDDQFEKYGKRAESVTIGALTFDAKIYSSETSSILAKIYDADNGLAQFNTTNDDKTVEAKDFDFVVNTTSSLSRVLDISKAYSYYKDGDSISLRVAYLPLTVVRHYKSQDILKTCLFVPVYYELITADGNAVVSGEKTTSILASYAVKEAYYDDGVLTYPTANSTDGDSSTASSSSASTSASA